MYISKKLNSQTFYSIKIQDQIIKNNQKYTKNQSMQVNVIKSYNKYSKNKTRNNHVQVLHVAFFKRY